MKNLVTTLAIAITTTLSAQVDPNGVTIGDDNCGNVSIKNSGSGINGSYFDDVYNSNIGNNGNSTLTGDITNTNTNKNVNRNKNVNNNTNSNENWNYNENNNTNTNTNRNVNRNNNQSSASSNATGGNASSNSNANNAVNVDNSNVIEKQFNDNLQNMVGVSALIQSSASMVNAVGSANLNFAQASAVRNATYSQYKLGRVEVVFNGQTQEQLSNAQQKKVIRIIKAGAKTEQTEFGYKVVYFKGKYRYDLEIGRNDAQIPVSGYTPAYWLTKTLIH